MAVFGMTTEEELASAMAIANCIQGAIPKGSTGGQVMFAMTLLIATGAMHGMPPEDREGAISEVIQTMQDVFEGRIVTAFQREH